LTFNLLNTPPPQNTPPPPQNQALNGQLEFFNVDEFETMATAEHFMATDVEWDPTGEAVFVCLFLERGC
jgi:hypothetical protein